jgi:hypothetical protein
VPAIDATTAVHALRLTDSWSVTYRTVKRRADCTSTIARAGAAATRESSKRGAAIEVVSLPVPHRLSDAATIA